MYLHHLCPPIPRREPDVSLALTLISDSKNTSLEAGETDREARREIVTVGEGGMGGEGGEGERVRG